MKTPAPPPDFDDLSRSMRNDPDRLVRALTASTDASRDYLPWDKIRYRTPPAGLTAEDWWWGLKTARLGSARMLPLLEATESRSFSFNLPDSLLRLVDTINQSASGAISMSEAVTNPSTRDRYIVSSLIEEAITSSQLEGASTSHQVAKEMLRSGRSPRDHSERMIFNNYQAMRFVAEMRDRDLTPEMVREIHRIVTDGTLEDPRDAGVVQQDQDERIAVWDDTGELLHRPPPFGELDDRLERLCTFANGEDGDHDFYLPPVLRALAVHFMAGYDHYFVDGNGRTARALFYWAMLRQGYWLTEFLTISTILKNAPSQYVASYLLTEQDDDDLTYFFLYHCGVVVRAIDALQTYLRRKADEVRTLHSRLPQALRQFNHRQVALLEHAVKNPGAEFTAKSHARSHNVTTQTARTDLGDLEGRGLLDHSSRGRERVWRAVAELNDRLKGT